MDVTWVKLLICFEVQLPHLKVGLIIVEAPLQRAAVRFRRSKDVRLYLQEEHSGKADYHYDFIIIFTKSSMGKLLWEQLWVEETLPFAITSFGWAQSSVF